MFSLTQFIRSFRLKIIPEIYENSECNEIYFCICITGGILLTKKEKYTSKYKRLWIIYQIGSFLISSTSIISYWLTVDEVDLQTLLAASHYSFSMVTVYILYAIIYHQFKNMEQFVEQMDEYTRKNPILSNKEDDENKNKNDILFGIILLTPFMIGVLGLVQKFLIPETDLNQMHLYLFPFPRFVNVNSIMTYFIISLVQGFITLRFSFAVHSMLRTLLLRSELKSSSFEDLLKNMQQISEFTLNELEKNHNRELMMEKKSIRLRNRYMKKFDQERKIIIYKFDDVVVNIAKKHWRLVSIESYSRGLFEFASSSFIAMFFLLNVPLGCVLMDNIKNFKNLNIWTLFVLNVVLTTIYVLYMLGNFVREEEEKQEEFSYEVYSTPWYLLPRQSRKNIYIFLTQTQYYRSFFIFNIWPLNMATVPQILNSCYSYALLLQKFITKSKFNELLE